MNIWGIADALDSSLLSNDSFKKGLNTKLSCKIKTVMEHNYFESHFFLRFACIMFPALWQLKPTEFFWQTYSAPCCLSAYIFNSEHQTTLRYQMNKEKFLPVKLSDPLWTKQTLSSPSKCSTLLICLPHYLSFHSSRRCQILVSNVSFMVMCECQHFHVWNVHPCTNTTMYQLAYTWK